MGTTRIRSSNQLYIDGVLDLNNFRLTNLSSPTGATDAVNKAYVDGIQSGLDIKESVRVATTSNLNVTSTTYTLTNSGVNAAFTLDGVSGLVLNDRILVKDQTNKVQNGIYILTTVGNASTPWVLTRASDFDNTPGIEITASAFCFVEEGVVNSDSGWTLSTNGQITIGTTELTFVQFSGAGQIIAGNGLTKIGNTINVASTGGGALSVSADSVNLSTVSVSSTTSGSDTGFVNSVTVDSYGRVTGVNKATIGTLNTLNVSGTTTLNNLTVTGNTNLAGTTFTATPGVAPFVVGSTTKVNNLNADQLDGFDSTYFVNTGITITAGVGMSGGGNLSANRTISHADTSSQANIAISNSNGNVVQGITLGFDDFGHTTGATVSSTNLDTRYLQVNATATNADRLDGFDSTYFVNTGITITAGVGMSGGGNLSANRTISHADTSSQANIAISNSNGNVVQGITLGFDDFGHTTGATVSSTNLDTRYLQVNATATNADRLDGFDSTYFVNTGITITAGVGMSGGGNLSANRTISHADTSSQANIAISNSNGNVVQGITLGFDDFGHTTGATVSSTNLDTRYLQVNAAATNADRLDGFHASDLTNAFRKYRLNSLALSPGNTVSFSYSGITGNNVTIVEDSFELFKNGLLLNGGGNDYVGEGTVNAGSKTITFTVADNIITSPYSDVFLLNFSYTKTI